MAVLPVVSAVLWQNRFRAAVAWVWNASATNGLGLGGRCEDVVAALLFTKAALQSVVCLRKSEQGSDDDCNTEKTTLLLFSTRFFLAVRKDLVVVAWIWVLDD